MEYVRPDSVLGVGTGSTVNCFIDALAAKGVQLEAAVSSSNATTQRLEEHGYRVRELNQAGTLDLYIDGADEFDAHRQAHQGRRRRPDTRKNRHSRQPGIHLHRR